MCDRRYAEVVGWHEAHTLVDSLKAEVGKQLEQIHSATYRAGELDVEAANRRLSELTEGIPFEVVYVQAWASRWRMLGVWRELTGIIAPGGRLGGRAQHYDEHLPRLREWVAELVGRRIVAR